ncbi:pyridoxal phosphate-dependent aminotransferase [candidate division KSB1 bacterium]|nr:pyridoxal phosphate-dependent aminotransferase [candidate division KSB1 bacterium]
MSLTSLLARLQRQGADVVSLVAGQPDFPTPPHVCRAAIQAIEEGHTKYTAVDGAHELKQAIADWIKAERGAVYSPDEIVVTCGAKHAVLQSLLAICDPGDEVILPVPYWVSYPEQIKLSDAIVKTVTPLGADLKITAAQLKQTITDRTKAFILNSPCNPSGAVYASAELAQMADVIRAAGIYVIADEIYDKIVFEQAFSSMTAFAEIRDQLIYINGVSKSYAMTGWRIGFLAAPQPVAVAVAKYQGHSTTNAASISQRAALAAYREEQSFVADMVSAYQERRDYVMGRLGGMRHVICATPQGTFYAFPELAAYYNKNKGVTSSFDLCQYLLENYGVALVPGSAFGMEGHVRLSFAVAMATLRKALDRVQAGLRSLAQQDEAT